MNLLQHMEAHRTAIPPPQPPPASTRINLAGELPPQETVRISQGTVAGDLTAKANQPKQEEPGQGGGVATPPGGGSGEIYTQNGGGASPEMGVGSASGIGEDIQAQ
jgi:hypothetical protein